MKKELFALLLLLLLFGGSIANIIHLRHLSSELTDAAEAASRAATAGDWAAAKEKTQDALNRWKADDRYTHIFVRHSEIDATTDCFCDLLGATAGEDWGEFQAALLSLESRLQTLYEMERLKPGSIL